MLRYRRLAATVWLACLSCTPLTAEPETGGETRTINGMEMYFEENGQGSPLVLLHYFGGCVRSWDPHVDELARHYRVIAVDLRGHGRSTNPSGVFTHRQSALDVFALLDELGIDRFRAMGISSGGMTLLHMATGQPDRVEDMVLIGATTYFPEQARTIMRSSTPEETPESEIQGIASCSSRGETQTREIISQFNRMQDSYDDMNFTPPYLSTINARTLIVHGDRDEYFPVNIPLEMYRAIPKSYLWIVPNGSHIPIFGNDSGPFRKQALAFLSGRW